MNYSKLITDWKLGNTSMVKAIRDALTSTDMEGLADALTNAVTKGTIIEKDVLAWNSKLNTEQHLLAKDMGLEKGKDYKEVWALKYDADDCVVHATLSPVRQKKAKQTNPLSSAVATFKQSPTIEHASAVNAIMLTMMEG